MKVSVVGATGAVGRAMLEELETLSQVSADDLSLFASPRSAGQMLDFRGEKIKVEVYDLNQVAKTRVCLMSAGSAFSEEHGERIKDAGVWVIDNSSAWRRDDRFPLIVPEVNGDLVKKMKAPTIIANPNCSTIQMIPPLADLEHSFGLERVSVSTYQSVSGAGQDKINQLAEEAKQEFPYLGLDEHSLAFNVIPAIDTLDEQGHCYEEVKMVVETRKILALPNLDVRASVARVPVFYGHSESLFVDLKKEIHLEDLESVFEKSAHYDYRQTKDYEWLPTPRRIQHKSSILVSRARVGWGEQSSKTAQFWVVADNLRKGAATNAVQILQLLKN
jgi:aspartate-semialdehyde dehydrogenase